MGKIIRLNTHLANMIAAGEVVEKPSSVVKELVENAIDAGANIIHISLLESGIQEIMVTDNGCGMSQEDAEVAFFRHATSKIRNEYDLFRIATLGFRGEALPSIAAVSKVSLVTNDGSGGFEVLYKSGIKEKSGPKAANLGTTVIVKDLFFNTPARLKYLKSPASELGSIVFLIGKLAIAHPNISFSLSNNRKEIIKTSGKNDFIRLFGELYGLDVAKNLLFKEYEGYGYKMKIILVKPIITRSNKQEITLITNGRYVKNNAIANSIIEGYYTYIPASRYPIATIFLEIDPLLIDVNVHPAKTEIKISNEDEIKEIVTKLVRETLESVQIIPSDKKLDVRTETSYVKENIFSSIYAKPKETEKPVIENIEVLEKRPETSITYDIKEDIQESKLSQLSDVEGKYNQAIEENNLLFPDFEYVGQVHGMYLIFQNSEGMYLMDQHAAAERIRYEYYHELLAHPLAGSKPLLIPYDISFTKEELIYVEENLHEFEKIGFKLEAFNDNSYFIREIPLWVDFDQCEDIVLKMIQMIIANKVISVSYFRDYLAKQISCKSSIKANKALDKMEIDDLVSQLKKCKNPYNCPHGRPTMVKMSTLDLQKMFMRVM